LAGRIDEFDGIFMGVDRVEKMPIRGLDDLFLNFIKAGMFFTGTTRDF
jgi:hypothetical protein